MKECTFDARNKCDIWIDYQIACLALQEAEEVSSSNWNEISCLLERVELLEKTLIKAGIDIPK